jgi:hypothetical protein
MDRRLVLPLPQAAPFSLLQRGVGCADEKEFIVVGCVVCEKGVDRALPNHQQKTDPIVFFFFYLSSFPYSFLLFNSSFALNYSTRVFFFDYIIVNK